MKRMLTLGMAALLLGLGGAASGQTTTMRSTHVRPNGAVATTTRRVGPGGTATTRTVDRPNGTRVVTRSRTGPYGRRTVRRTVRRTGYTWRHGRRMERVRLCRVHWRHHRRERFCTWQWRDYRGRGRGRDYR